MLLCSMTPVPNIPRFQEIDYYTERQSGLHTPLQMATASLDIDLGYDT